MSATVWTDAKRQALADGYLAGKSYTALAAENGTSKSAVASIIRRMGLRESPQLKAQTERPGILIDLTGQKFTRLTVIRRDGAAKCRSARWLCRCECGTQRTVSAMHLRGGAIKSCGCLRRQMMAQVQSRHAPKKEPAPRPPVAPRAVVEEQKTATVFRSVAEARAWAAVAKILAGSRRTAETKLDQAVVDIARNSGLYDLEKTNCRSVDHGNQAWALKQAMQRVRVIAGQVRMASYARQGTGA